MDHKFGVVEIASTRTVAAPGWAYVPDTTMTAAAAAAAAAAAGVGGNRKRAARNQGPVASAADLGVRQEARLRKELDELDRDCQRDTNAAIPVRNPATRVQAKHTPNVRKILLSQKTFANHLDDFHAMQALAETQPGHANQYTYLAKGQEAPSARGRRRRQSQGAATLAQAAAAQPDVDMEDAEPEPASLLASPPHEEHSYPEEDSNPLLASRVPPSPTDDEIRNLLAAPPLNYSQAAARWPADDGPRYPPRRFCELCGYWARLKCVRCGGKLCALECLELHKEECITRYGL